MDRADEFSTLRPIILDVVAGAARALLMTDFGMESAWAMEARESFLGTAGSHEASHRIDVALHPASLHALQAWLAQQRFDQTYIGDRRVARLRQATREARGIYESHPWFHGRRLEGATHPPLPAWFDSGLLWAFPHDDAHPVILRPEVSKGSHGMNVTYFKMERVPCPTKQS